MASKENQEALNKVKKTINYRIIGQDCFKEFCTLQKAIDDLQIKNIALERACSMVSFYEGMDYKYFVEKYVSEAKKDIEKLKELENGK